MDEYGRMMPMLGTAEEGIKNWSDPATEKLRQGSTEIWESYNETSDAHPVHLHMVRMHLVNRQKLQAEVDMITGRPDDIRLIGQPVAPAPDEAGWKDTYISYPGEVLRVIANFDLAGQYAWHCHILSHEDHEMMRPFYVGINPNMGMKKSITIAPAELEKTVQLQTIPNPFSTKFTVGFILPKASLVTVRLLDSKGSLVRRVFQGTLPKGSQRIDVEGNEQTNGIYYCEVNVDGQRMIRKMVLQK
jgi:spore coat protein A